MALVAIGALGVLASPLASAVATSLSLAAVAFSGLTPRPLRAPA